MILIEGSAMPTFNPSARTSDAHKNHGANHGDLWLRACVQTLQVDGASILLYTRTRGWHTVAATDETVARIDQVQRAVGEGPGIEAITSGLPVQVPDWTPHTGRWPLFAAGLGTDAVRALFALPLELDGATCGTLHLYRTTPGALSPAALNTAWLTADTVTATLTTTSQD
jgi:hypothetical protein